MTNREVAKILRETAQLLEVDGAQIGRYRSYERAAQQVEALAEPVEQVASEGRLREIPGIGERMEEHIKEILKTGKYSKHQKLLKKYPAGLLEMLQVQGLGPKKVAVLWKKFKAKSVEDVRKLAAEQKLRDLAGFGEKTEQNLLKATTAFQQMTGRFLQNQAEETAARLIAHIENLGKKVENVTAAGSLRRGRETIGDLDLLLTSSHAEEVSRHILAYPEVADKIALGENKVSVKLTNGMQVDVRILEKKSYGAALMYFTGSKAHNIVLRGLARDKGWTLNEYALATIRGGKWVAGKTEEEIYKKLGLAYIEPELREDTGEIDAAREGRLPKLVELSDIRGDLQMHTKESDGKNTIEEMAEAARKLGYAYIAITDHSKSVTVANGMDEKRTLAHAKRIREASKKFENGFRILAGIEVDILKDGRLDLDDEVLAQLDVVVASVHSFMNLEAAEMTERLLAAIENPHTMILGHPTGRLLLRREPYRYDLEKILAACKKRGVAVECNAFPDRLDLRDVDLRAAKEHGVKVVISTDAHSTGHLPFIKYGVRTARRGWIEKADVLNTLPCDALLKALRKG
ncbi:MAG TPA: DNA polymerase/3'-5' exonuclease PolX [Candidatus Xenobia bacterium]|nr:DNA polymerase/3'-5' exonuclease PolX [Candidatus Xenobia bacterium]